MKYLIIKYYTEVKDKSCNTHPNGKKILRECKEPESLRVQYQVFIETQIRNNQEVIKDGDGQLQVKTHPKKNRIIEKRIFAVECPSRNKRQPIEFGKRYFRENCQIFNSKRKHQIDEKVQKQDKIFSNRPSYGNKKIREKCFSLMNTNFKTIKDLIKKPQNMKYKTKLKLH